MSAIRWSLSATLLLFLVQSSLGQREADRRRTELPSVGSMLPEITVHDEDGAEFSTASLQGHYTVLVFGCLT